MRRSIPLTLAVLVTFALAGCSGIPSSGSVHAGEAVTVADANEIQYLPSGPRDGASRSDLLSGFLEAASSPQNDFAIAREFLTPDAKVTWDPSAITVIDSGDRTYPATDAASQVVSVSTQAILDATGRYVEQPAGSRFDLTYTFEQRGGQWRLSSVPQGIVIDATTFGQVFRQTSLYFLTADHSSLVPDVRWFPARAATTTRVTKALLSGPSSWLAETGAVVSAFPSGTQLVADTVPVQSGVAGVDLSGAGMADASPDLPFMQAQLTATLTQVSGVLSVDLSVSGTPVTLADNRSLVSRMTPAVSSSAIVVRGGKLGYASGSVLERIGAIPQTLPQAGVRGVTVGVGNTLVAVLSDEGVTRIMSKSAQSVVDSRPNLIAPGIDANDVVWTVTRDDPSEIRLTTSAGVTSSLTPPWAGATSIEALRVSADGSRVVAFVSDRGSPHIYVASVARSSDGTPVALGSPVELSVPAGTPVDAVWMDATTIASVGVDDVGVGHVLTEVIGGRSSSYATLTAPVALSGGVGLSSLRALLADGRVMSLRLGNTWTVELTGIQALGTTQ